MPGRTVAPRIHCDQIVTRCSVVALQHTKPRDRLTLQVCSAKSYGDCTVYAQPPAGSGCTHMPELKHALIFDTPPPQHERLHESILRCDKALASVSLPYTPRALSGLQSPTGDCRSSRDQCSRPKNTARTTAAVLFGASSFIMALRRWKLTVLTLMFSI